MWLGMCPYKPTENQRISVLGIASSEMEERWDDEKEATGCGATEGDTAGLSGVGPGIFLWCTAEYQAKFPPCSFSMGCTGLSPLRIPLHGPSCFFYHKPASISAWCAHSSLATFHVAEELVSPPLSLLACGPE